MIFGYSILATALLLSLTAAYYSVAGLTAIFAAATLPIIIMGGSLELGKVVATVWLHNNWKRIPYLFKVYLIPAILFLMFLTSMGIFGFLSKAHLEHATTLGDGAAQVALYDDKIKTAKENIESARTALKQMDATVNLTMDRSTDAGSVQSAANMRKRQSKERADLQKEIAGAQAEIVKLQELRAPLAVEARKIEAEVGPIKYIAALMYGDNPDSNLLERAVRWVIILIVLVFDPLALCLILAANLQFEWARHGRGGFVHDEPEEDILSSKEYFAAAPITPMPVVEPVVPAELTPYELPTSIPTEKEYAALTESYNQAFIATIPAEEQLVLLNTEFDDKIARYNDEPADEEFDPELVALAESALERIAEAEAEDEAAQEAATVSAEEVLEDIPEVVEPVVAPIKSVKRKPRIRVRQPKVKPVPLLDEFTATLAEAAENMPKLTEEQIAADAAIPAIADLLNITDTAEPVLPKMVEVITEYVDPNTRIKSFVHNWVPEESVNFAAVVDDISTPKTRADFGSAFPPSPNKGDMYLRVDFLPAKLHKFNGVKWMEVDKTTTDNYAFNVEYVKYLIEKINSGEYSIDDLSETEQDQIAEFLNNNANDKSN